MEDNRLVDPFTPVTNKNQGIASADATAQPSDPFWSVQLSALCRCPIERGSLPRAAGSRPAKPTHYSDLVVAIPTASMLVVMAIVAWSMYKKAGLAMLPTSWVNFDFIRAVTLLIVRAVALL